ncbi:HD domain-containing protein [Bradyrhizobium sp. AUGA SZCCT0222]|uniref:HD-GYP domain-containing protein n=1 Tax=Bradyrhizobium sp. AUGA SZCCT0222 TaxID=2807668 RepID=UPI001BAE497A|nr:HD domain-containing phosphohydrolase [Bradyrhizobium sp. AUGA SZCCT0222]MBR1272525.1 HD domain-containing protein [Bradyrhizobium sp. AUGA SZCCT0222]
MLVHFVTDEPTKIPAIRAMLEPQYDVQSQLLGTGNARISSGGVLMVDADLRKPVPVEQIKRVLQDLRCASEKLFVVQNHLHHMVAQAYALGATAVVSRPKEIISKLQQIDVAQRAAQAGIAVASTEITDGAAAFASMFAAIREGKPLTLSSAEDATSEIVNGIEQNGLGVWLDDVRRYHQGTFQHCLLVTGVAVGFALSIKFSNADVKRLGLAATLHDVGKARIPLAILDKPGRLDPGEEEIMKRHPIIGYELLKDLPGISPETLDGVRHHHEFLDGSGYPDGLTAPEISDLVRLLTISDIFAALIESRPYRPAMSRQDAYKILCAMDGKLERSLVKAFQNVALTA